VPRRTSSLSFPGHRPDRFRRPPGADPGFVPQVSDLREREPAPSVGHRPCGRPSCRGTDRHEIPDSCCDSRACSCCGSPRGSSWPCCSRSPRAPHAGRSRVSPRPIGRERILPFTSGETPILLNTSRTRPAAFPRIPRPTALTPPSPAGQRPQRRRSRLAEEGGRAREVQTAMSAPFGTLWKPPSPMSGEPIGIGPAPPPLSFQPRTPLPRGQRQRGGSADLRVRPRGICRRPPVPWAENTLGSAQPPMTSCQMSPSSHKPHRSTPCPEGTFFFQPGVRAQHLP
jgi:hypothetical protein